MNQQAAPAGRGARILAMVGVPVLIWIAAVALAVSLRDRLPEPVAVHYSVSGAADGFLGFWANLAVLTVLLVVTGGVAGSVGLSASRPPAVARVAGALAVGVTILITGIFGLTLASQRGLADAAQGRLELWWIPVLLVVAGAAGAATYTLMPRPTTTDLAADPDAPRVPLAAGVRAVWVRSQRMAGLTLLIPALLLGGTVIGFVVDSWLPLWVAGLVAGLMAAMGFWTVTIDHAGLRYQAVLGLPRRTVALDHVIDATVVQAHPLRDVGGWGIRMNRQGGTGLYLRAGEAIEVHIRDSAPLVVTVDDAATGAGLLNTLLDRAR